MRRGREMVGEENEKEEERGNVSRGNWGWGWKMKIKSKIKCNEEKLQIYDRKTRIWK